MTGAAGLIAPSTVPPVDGTQPNWRESGDNYAGLVLKIYDCTRIIECRAGIQWIIQKRGSAHEASTARWNGLSYHRSRAGLLAALAGLRIDLTADQRLVLDQLPAWVQP